MASMNRASLVGFSLASMAKLELITARSTSSRVRGSMAASASVIWRFLGLSTMSLAVAMTPTPSFSFSRPAFSRMARARPPLVGSLGMAILAPSGTDLMSLIFLEYTPMGSMWTLPTETRDRFRSLQNFSRYGRCWKKLASISLSLRLRLGFT